MDTQQGSKAEDGGTNRKKPSGGLLGLYWRTRDLVEEKGNPIKRTVAALVLVVVGVMVNEAFGYGRSKLVGPDEFLVQLKQDQDKAFKALEARLGDIDRSVDSSGRDALAEVKGAVREIKSANAGLMAQLALAKAENERLSRVGGTQAGAVGGYDLILTANTGVALGADAELGVQGVSGRGAYVALNDEGSDGRRQFLRSGESIAYQGEGRNCDLTLLSVSGGQAASFRNRCS